MICEFCGKEHDGSYGSGRFCSKSCRMKHIVSKVKNHKCNWPHHEAKGDWECKICEKTFRTKKELQEHRNECHEENCKKQWNKGLTKDTNESIRRGSETYKNA